MPMMGETRNTVSSKTPNTRPYLAMADIRQEEADKQSHCVAEQPFFEASAG